MLFRHLTKTEKEYWKKCALITPSVCQPGLAHPCSGLKALFFLIIWNRLWQRKEEVLELEVRDGMVRFYRMGVLTFSCLMISVVVHFCRLFQMWLAIWPGWMPTHFIAGIWTIQMWMSTSVQGAWLAIHSDPPCIQIHTGHQEDRVFYSKHTQELLQLLRSKGGLPSPNSDGFPGPNHIFW